MKAFCEFVFRLVLLILLVLLSISAYSQSENTYSFIVAGHGYGSHSGGNLGLHPAFLHSLNSGFDTSAAFIVLTGDIVNQSTTESWQQVEHELTGIGLPSYYVMGNHDANDIGWGVFESRHGSTYYSFHMQSELFIVLNSTEAQRSISSNQIDFLSEQLKLAGDTIRNIFIFFHEVLWNSHEKYVEVRSNSRSRYDQIVNYSNYWEDIHPLLIDESDKNIYLITGDVGGNPDAVAVFYDKWEHITFISSGMGEVADENYLLVKLTEKDTVEFKLVPLNNQVILDSLHYYSVPPATGEISGPLIINVAGNTLEYYVPEVYNADSYRWQVPQSSSGESHTNTISIDFEQSFTMGTLSVSAARDGYGAGPASSLLITADPTTVHLNTGTDAWLELEISHHEGTLCIKNGSTPMQSVIIKILDINGRCLVSKRVNSQPEYPTEINTDGLISGTYFITVFGPNQVLTKKIAICLE